MRLALLFFVSLAAAAQAGAQTPAGSGSLSGRERLRVEDCTRDAGSANVAFTLAANGAWSASAHGQLYTGTSNTTRRTTRLAFDGGSEALLSAHLDDEAEDDCEGNFSLTELGGTLKVNKRETRAKLRIDARGNGVFVRGVHAKFRLKAKGRWN